MATTYAKDNLRELWALFGVETDVHHKFREDSGEEALHAHFARVDCRDVEAWTVFPDAEAIRRHLAATIRRRYLAGRVPEIAEPLRVRNHQVVFVAEKAA